MTKYILIFLFLFSFSKAHASESGTVFIENSTSFDEKFIFYLNSAYEEILKEDFTKALNSFEQIALILKNTDVNPAHQFLVNFGLIIVYDNLKDHRLEQTIQSLVSSVAELKNNASNNLNSSNLSDYQDKKNKFFLIFEILVSKSSSQEAFGFLSIVYQDIKLDIIDTILTDDALIVSRKSFWKKEGWLDEFADLVEKLTDVFARLINCYNKLHQAIYGS